MRPNKKFIKNKEVKNLLKLAKNMLNKTTKNKRKLKRKNLIKIK